MTLVLCPECGRLMATVSMQTEDDKHHAVLVCRPCGKTYRMSLEETEGEEDTGKSKLLEYAEWWDRE